MSGCERKQATTKATAGPSTALRFAQDDGIFLVWGGRHFGPSEQRANPMESIVPHLFILAVTRKMRVKMLLKNSTAVSWFPELIDRPEAGVHSYFCIPNSNSACWNASSNDWCQVSATCPSEQTRNKNTPESSGYIAMSSLIKGGKGRALEHFR